MKTPTSLIPSLNIDPDKIMKYISLSVLTLGILMLFASCRPQRSLVQSRSCSLITERLTPHALAADTADVTFRIVESNHRLTIAEPRITAPPNTDTRLAIDTDQVSVTLIRHPDTIYLPSREHLRTDTIYIRPDPTPPKRHRPTLHDTLKMLSITIAISILFLIIIKIRIRK